MWIWILTKNDSFYTQRDILPAFYMKLIVYCRYLLCIRLLQLSYWFFINLINARLFIHVYHQVRYLDISGSNLIKEVLHNLQSTIKINWSLQKIKEKKRTIVKNSLLFWCWPLICHHIIDSFLSSAETRCQFRSIVLGHVFLIMLFRSFVCLFLIVRSFADFQPSLDILYVLMCSKASSTECLTCSWSGCPGA